MRGIGSPSWILHGEGTTQVSVNHNIQVCRRKRTNNVDIKAASAVMISYVVDLDGSIHMLLLLFLLLLAAIPRRARLIMGHVRLLHLGRIAIFGDEREL